MEISMWWMESFHSSPKLTVKNGAIKGYMKPLFKDVDVYDPEQDKDKGLLQKLYEGVVRWRQ